MKTENIKKLAQIEENRHSNIGYLTNHVNIRPEGLNEMAIVGVGPCTARTFVKFLRQAVLEKEAELVDRAYELEELEYRETLALAKKEAADILKFGRPNNRAL